ncbi:hypothetical protein CAJAP_02996 [Camponotus japonicus]
MKIKQGYWYRLLLAITILSGHIKAEKQKRQIFREQVLPALGGKIPDEAFKTDRLALNRLNKEGITIPDGIVLDARHVHKHPHSDQRMPTEIIKVYLTSDGRYVSPEGQTYYNHPKTVDTTYIIRRPFMHTNCQTSNNFENVKLRSYPKPQIYSNYGQFVPIVPPIKPDIYKSIITPLILPTNKDLFNLPSWRLSYDWDTVYEPFNDYFVNNIALFNSHQIIEDYQGFLNKFYKRTLRHVSSKSGNMNHQEHHEVRNQDLKLSPILYQKIISNIANFHNSAYASIPETSFSCHERKEKFVNIETNCQVKLTRQHRNQLSTTQLKLGPVSFIFKLSADMLRNWQDILSVLLATILVTFCSAIVQKQVPVDDYYDEYQNFQPVVGFRRPIVVKEELKKEQDLSKIPGIPGVDYPIYHVVPPTSFSCAYVPIIPGMYANVETGCQAYHICHDGREGHQGASFLCTNGTLFNQHEFACDWWYNVNCATAPMLYRLNADPLKNPYVSKETKDEIRKRLKIVVF